MLHFIYEVLKTAGVTVIIGCVVVTVVLLAGCEGAGFENHGKHSRPACMYRDARGHEVWRSC